MNTIWNWIVTNKEWIFSGVGIFVLGLLLNVYRLKKKHPTGDIIVTHGDQSPGKVDGNYEVRISDKK